MREGQPLSSLLQRAMMREMTKALTEAEGVGWREQTEATLKDSSS